MNKIYKLVWNKVRQCYVVACEFAKSHTKSCSSGIVSRQLLGMALMLTLLNFSVVVHADGDDNGQNVSTDIETVVSQLNEKVESLNSSVIGLDSSVTALGSSLSLTQQGVSELETSVQNLGSNLDLKASVIDLNSLSNTVGDIQNQLDDKASVSAVQELSNSVSSLGSDIEEALKQEIERAKQAEQTNAENIDKNAQAISDEKTVREQAVNGLSGELTDVKSKVEDNTQKIADNVSAIGEINGKLNVVNDKVDANAQDIINEVQAREEAVSGLSESLSGVVEAETNRAKLAEETNAQAIADEVTARELAIADEKQAREEALNKAISDEVEARQEAVTGLSGELSDVKGKVAANVQGILDNKSAIESVVNDLADTNSMVAANVQGILDNKSAIEGVANDLADTNSKVTINEQNIANNVGAIGMIKDELVAVNSGIETNTQAIIDNAQAISNEVNAREEAVAGLNSSLTGLVEAEANRAKLAEEGNSEKIAKNTQAILDEAEARTNAISILDNSLSSVIADETDRAKLAEEANAKAVSDEVLARTQAISELNTELSKVVSDEVQAREEAVSALESSLTDSLNGEIARAKQVEEINAQAISDEVLARSQAISELNTELSNSIAGEVTAREQAVNAINDSIGTVADGRYVLSSESVSGNLAILDGQLADVSDRTQHISLNSDNGNTVIGNNLDVNGDVSVNGTISGLTNNKIIAADLPSYENSTVAATQGQLFDIASKGLMIKANNGTFAAPLASEIAVVGDGNIYTTSATGSRELLINLKKDISNISSISTVSKDADGNVIGSAVLSGSGIVIPGSTSTSTVSLTSNGLNNGYHVLGNIKPGEADNDAVTVSQLNANKVIFAPKDDTVTITVDEDFDPAEGTKYLVHFNDKYYEYSAAGKVLQLDEDTNTFSVKFDEATLSGGDKGLTLNSNLVLGKQKLEINGDVGTLNKLTNRTWDPGNYVSGQAATEDQLKLISDEGWILKGDYNSYKNALGSVVQIKGDDLNISTIVNPSTGVMSIGITDEPEFKIITATQELDTPAVWGLTNKNFGSVTAVTGVDNRTGNLGSIKDYAGSSRAASEAQLYNAVSNMSKADRYITDGDLIGDDLVLYQNNAENITVDLHELRTYVSSAVAGANPKIKRDADNDGNMYNWTITERDEDNNIVQQFDNTTLATELSERTRVDETGRTIAVKSGGSSITGTAVNEEATDSVIKNRVYGQSYTLMDTAGNKVTIADIASAETLKDIDGNVVNHEGRIGTLEQGFSLRAGTESNQTSRVFAEDTLNITTNQKQNLVNKNMNVDYKIELDGKMDTIDISISDNPTFTTVVAGIDGESKVEIGTSGVSYDGKAYIAADGLNAWDKTISNVKAGDVSSTSKDAINGAQFYEVHHALEEGLKIKAGENVLDLDLLSDSGHILKVVGDDKNITTSVKSEDNSLKIAISDSPEFKAVTVGDSSSSIVINGLGQGKIDGLKNTTWVAGETVAIEGRAATEDQLESLDDGLTQKGMDFKVDNTTVHQNIGTELTIVGGAYATNVTDNNIAVISNEDNTIDIKLSKDIDLDSDGSVTVGNSVMDSTGLLISSGSGEGTATQSAKYSNTGIVITRPSDSDKADLAFNTSNISVGSLQINNMASGIDGTMYDVVNDNNAASIGDVKALTTDVESGNNINVVTDTVNGQKVVTVNLNDNITLGEGSTAVNIDGESGSVLIGNGDNKVLVDGTTGNVQSGKIVLNSLNNTMTVDKVVVDGNGYITGLQNKDYAVASNAFVSGRAATEDQLHDIVDKTSGGWGFASDDTGIVKQNIGSSLVIKGGKNITTKTLVNGIEVNLDDKVELGTGNATVVLDGTTGNISAGKEGTITAGVGENNISLNGKTAVAKIGSKVSIDGINGNVNIGDIQFNKESGKVTIKGLSNTAWSDDIPANSDRVATEGQIYSVVNKSTGGWGLTDDAGDEKKADIGKTLAVTGDGNIKTKVTSTGLEVQLNNTVDLTDAGSLSAGSVVVNDGLTVNDGPVFSKSKIDAADLKIQNVASAELSQTSTDAVNGSQLYATNQNVTNNAGNIAVNAAAISDNVDNIQVNADNIKLNKTAIQNVADDLAVTNGKLQDLDDIAVKYDDTTRIKVTMQGVGGTAITNVKAGEISQTSTDVVNGSQLYTTNQNVSKNAEDIAQNKADIVQNAVDIVDLTNELANTNANVSVNADNIDLNKLAIQGVASDLADTKVNLQDLDDIVVKYDDATRTKVTMQGVGGTTVTNVKAGEISQTSTDVVNGSQLFTTNQNVTKNAEDIVQNAVDIKVNADNIQALVDDLAVTNGKLQDLDDIAVKYDGMDKTKVTMQGVGGTVITNVKAGEVSQTSTDVVNGSQLYTTNQNVSKNADDIAQNKADIATNVDNIKANADNIDLNKVAIQNVADDLADTNENLQALDDIAVKYDNATKQRVILEGTDGTVLDNVKAGLVAENSMEASYILLIRM